MKIILFRDHRLGRRPRLGTFGYSICLAFSITVAIVAQGWRIALVCGLALVLATVFHPEGLKPLASRRLWLLLGILIVTLTLFMEPGDWAVGGITLSRQGLALGLQMALRAVTLLVAVTGFAAAVSVSELAGLLERFGFKGLGFATGVAFNMLPIVRETATNAYQAIRLRGGFRRRRWHALRLWLITVITNSLRQADDIVTAAEASAFSTRSARPMPLSRGRGDFVLAGALLVVAILLAA